MWIVADNLRKGAATNTVQIYGISFKIIVTIKTQVDPSLLTNS
jgi:N-acetyl-gamma-glutamylphosphate reductase